MDGWHRKRQATQFWLYVAAAGYFLSLPQIPFISFSMSSLSKSFCSVVLSSIVYTVHNRSSCTPKTLRPQIIVPQLQIAISSKLWVPTCEKAASFINLDQHPLVCTASCWTWWLSITKIISDLSSYLLCLGWLSGYLLHQLSILHESPLLD